MENLEEEEDALMIKPIHPQLKDVALSVSSAKSGHGVQNLINNDPETFWQSDGLQPHLINAQFLKRMTISQVDLLLNYQADESYSPLKIAILTGPHIYDLVEICQIELSEPKGWISFQLSTPNSNTPVRAHYLQIAVMAAHQNGRDCRIRGLAIYGCEDFVEKPKFKSTNFVQYQFLR